MRQELTPLKIFERGKEKNYLANRLTGSTHFRAAEVFTLHPNRTKR